MIQPNLHNIYTKGCSPVCNRPWDVSGIINRPSGINFALEISRNGHTNNGNLIFHHLLLIVIKCCFLLLLWHGLACFVMLCHPLSSKERDPRAQREWGPRTQRNGTPGHKGPINREAGGPTGTGGSGGRSPPSKMGSYRVPKQWVSCVGAAPAPAPRGTLPDRVPRASSAWYLA